MVDYLLDECPYDFITCELGVNMRVRYSPDEFEKRASYVMERLVQTGKPALIITTFPNCRTSEYTTEPDNPTSASETAFNQILEKLVKDAACPTVQLVHGFEILDDLHGLGGDLLHPTPYGHAVMGFRLAERLQAFLSECGMKV